MNYHINTILIWDSFKSDSECPICDIQRDVEDKIVDQFLNEAVMIDEMRKLVNDEGFCGRHFKMLFDGKNKLGTSLQTLTRLKTIIDNLKTVSNDKGAKALAQKIHNMNTCCLCSLINFNMDKYYENIASLYHKDDEFKNLFINSKGFCMEHFAKLLEFSGYAKGSQGKYVETLSGIQVQNLNRLHGELNWFCDKFDYRNSDKPWGNSRDALQRVINKLKRNTL